MLDLEFAELTDPGRVRENNEDAVGHVLPATPAMVQSQGWFFCLADGMGAHAKGEVASRLAIDTALDGFRKIPKGVMHVSLLPRLVQEANAAVYDAGHAQGGGGMGCTFVGCALRFDSAVVAHVGDSRCYLLRNGILTQLTHDHTMANEQVRLGILSAADAGSGEGRHLLTRSIGQELFVAADTITVNIIPGDLLFLCSDGLHGYVEEQEIRFLLDTRKPLEEIATSLIAAANKAGGYDNVSVQLIRVRSVERMGLYRGRPYRLL
ncbi:protein phosphatase [Granulicella rosea]|uniref:Protein phosphatase n=1 Tax=Granulicella rosea TaxID=474952 RepID=A0A239EE37_9BACT|nr:protein phosphatase 2C domain-containing protein [Granulicella rosea]SNS42935.1 protein phosphatase [Granulicella rosea]